MANRPRDHWLTSMRSQVAFYLRTGTAKRKDAEYQWAAYESTGTGSRLETRRLARQLKYKLGLRGVPPMSIDWMQSHGDLLWDARAMLSDDLSKLLFDSALVVRLTSHRRFYFPRIDFDDLIEILTEHPFGAEHFPHDYLGVPLGVYEIKLLGREALPGLKIITRRIQLQLVNNYRQYLARREGVDFSPKPGDVVVDCGACIGEISLLFAGLVAPTGAVHLFDPISLHTRFCELQAALNPAYAPMLHINTLAIGERSHTVHTALADSIAISPGAISADTFSTTSIDDYAATKLDKVDFIKMDIEGAELSALKGASSTIRRFKPRLAISAYHKPEDLWELPNKIKDLNPGYKLAFGHHTPIIWESVVYAID